MGCFIIILACLVIFNLFYTECTRDHSHDDIVEQLKKDAEETKKEMEERGETWKSADAFTNEPWQADTCGQEQTKESQDGQDGRPFSNDSADVVAPAKRSSAKHSSAKRSKGSYSKDSEKHERKKRMDAVNRGFDSGLYGEHESGFDRDNYDPDIDD